MNKASTENNSVMFALDQLTKMEVERVDAQDKAVAARAAAEQKAREDAERQAREHEEHARRVAEAEAELRIRAEKQTREAEAATRMAVLRAELGAVRADRERIQARIVSPIEPEAPRRSRGWAALALTASAVAASLAFLMVLHQPTVPAPIVVEVPVERVVTEVPEPVADPEPIVVAEVADDPEPETTTRRPHIIRRDDTTTTTTTTDDEDILGLGHCADDDLLCGAEIPTDTFPF